MSASGNTKTSAEIRKTFLQFFESKGHKIVPSAPIVVKNDPSLLFTNAGMNQFKDYFLGNEQSPSPRIADTQKCLRVSGKHNDLEEVGVDTYHHTMFEMLGNWSFGDYFKKEAIQWAWELLTEVYQLNPEHLYVTVFEGDPSQNIPFDQESYDSWKQLLPEERILRGNKKDNFWEMGDTGPCGPCTEIHADIRLPEERAAKAGKELVNMGHPQVIEIWNNVFIEFNRKADGSLEKLPAQHVDTGMGFERLCMVMQGKRSNYDTDVFSPLIQSIEKACGKKYRATASEDESVSIELRRNDIAIRVIADHIRAVSFAIADGQLPSNAGAGYVIRRILRRAIRYGYSVLGMQQPFIYRLTAVLAGQTEDVFPELKAQLSFVEEVIREEEVSFLRTLQSGIKRFQAIREETEGTGAKMISGARVFELFDTYGFPADLTRLMASELGLQVDEQGFEKEMEAQRSRARKAGATEQTDWIFVHEGSKTLFTGYDSLQEKSQILRYRKVKSKDQEIYQIVLDRSPFYAESGGQIGDTGELDFGAEVIRVTDTRKENDLLLHFCNALPAQPELGLTARVDSNKRMDTRKNHSATHLLQAALREVLGNHVEQKGSLVGPDYLRFDFSHFSKMSREDLQRVEWRVNEKIQQNIALDEQRDLPIGEALAQGATALFGEKYGETVRMITFDPTYSRELCGGTHVQATGEIGLFKIVSEGSVAAGVRRIEAITGPKALEWLQHIAAESEGVRILLKNPKDTGAALESILHQQDEMRKRLERLQEQSLNIMAKELWSQHQDYAGVKFLSAHVSEVEDAESMRKLGMFLTRLAGEKFVLLLHTSLQAKYMVHLRTDSAHTGWNANQLLKELAPEIRGGGPSDFVQAVAAGPEAAAKLSHALEQKIQSPA